MVMSSECISGKQAMYEGQETETGDGRIGSVRGDGDSLVELRDDASGCRSAVVIVRDASSEVLVLRPMRQR